MFQWGRTLCPSRSGISMEWLLSSSLSSPIFPSNSKTSPVGKTYGCGKYGSKDASHQFACRAPSEYALYPRWPLPTEPVHEHNIIETRRHKSMRIRSHIVSQCVNVCVFVLLNVCSESWKQLQRRAPAIPEFLKKHAKYSMDDGRCFLLVNYECSLEMHVPPKRLQTKSDAIFHLDKRDLKHSD